MLLRLVLPVFVYVGIKIYLADKFPAWMRFSIEEIKFSVLESIINQRMLSTVLFSREIEGAYELTTIRFVRNW